MENSSPWEEFSLKSIPKSALDFFSSHQSEIEKKEIDDLELVFLLSINVSNGVQKKSPKNHFCVRLFMILGAFLDFKSAKNLLDKDKTGHLMSKSERGEAKKSFSLSCSFRKAMGASNSKSNV